MNPSEDLLVEHEGVLRVLDILETICNRFSTPHSLPLAHIESILDFLKVFVDKCHHGKEEDFLFPALSAAGTPNQMDYMAHLLDEHAKGRALVIAMTAIKERFEADPEAAGDDLTIATKSYTDLMRHHINSENSKLFPLVDSLLSKEEQARMVEQFERLESERIGEGRHEAFHEMIHNLSQLYLR